MFFSLAFFAAIVPTGAGAPQPSVGGPPLLYQVRVVEMSDLSWRVEAHHALTLVKADSGQTIWTAPKATADAIQKAASQTIAAPKVLGVENAPVHVSQRKTRTVQAGQGPSNPPVREGFTLTLAGRKLDQGILTRVVLDDLKVVEVHRVGLPASDEASGGAFQIPEVFRSEVSGEWLIPHQGALVIGLGAYTKADASGKAITRERLAIVEAATSNDATAFVPRDASTRPVTMVTTGTPARAWSAPVMLPATALAVPSRSLPAAFDAQGRPAELPPLPIPAPPTFLADQADPCPSPQVQPKVLGEPVPESRLKTALLDTQAGRASFTTVNPSPSAAPARNEPKGASTGSAPVANRTFSVRVPLSGRLILEINGLAPTTRDDQVELPPVIPTVR